MPEIKSMKDLQNALLPVMKDMTDKLADQVYKTLNYFLQSYYDSYDPIYYRRQYDFLRSVIKVGTTGSRRRGKAVTAYVYIDTYSMDNYYSATGNQVATWANQGLHGGKDLGTNTPHVWDDTMANTIENGELVRAALDYLRKQGFDVEVR